MRSSNPLIIVNADDFGMSSAVSQGIVHCFRRNLISSATVLANFAGFEEACDIAHTNKLTDKLGIHINLTEGRPICSRLLSNRHLCDDDGNFRRHRPRFLTTEDLTQISMEVAAQIDVCQRNGIPLTHADSHQHVHNEPFVFFAVKRVLQNSGIQFLRITRNLYPGGSTPLAKRIFKSLFNWSIDRSRLRGIDYFGSVDDFASHKQSGDWGSFSYEILTHPKMNPDGDLVDHVDQCPLEEKLLRVFDGLTKSSYRDLMDRSPLQSESRNVVAKLEGVNAQVKNGDAISASARLTGSC